MYVEIKNNKVKSISAEKNETGTDLTKTENIVTAVLDEVIWRPHILIYDMDLVPVTLPTE